jgi:hypothetical protein
LIEVNRSSGSSCKAACMCPLPQSPVLAHARGALARIEEGVAGVRDRLGHAEGRDLEDELACLLACYASLEAASDEQVPALWSRFFMCYDRVLATLRSLEKHAHDFG